MSGTRRFTQIDEATGEAIGSFVAVIKPKAKSDFQRHFTMNQETLFSIANDLNHDQTRVFLALLSYLDYENFIQVPQVEIAEKLSMQKQNVNRAIRSLIGLGIIFDGPKVGRSKSFRLNPNYGWKGSSANHRKALKNGFEVIDGGRV